MAIRVLPDYCPGCGRLKDPRYDYCGKCAAKLRKPVSINGRGEPEVVLTEEICPVIQQFKKAWYADRNPNLTNKFDTEESTRFMSPVDYLSYHADMHPRRIAGIVKQEYKTIGLSDAEKLLIAMDREYLLSNGTIRIVPNPNWSTLKWVMYMSERGCR